VTQNSKYLSHRLGVGRVRPVRIHHRVGPPEVTAGRSSGAADPRWSLRSIFVGVRYPVWTITSKASAGSPPSAAGPASRSMTFDQCQKVQGHPWLRISGTGSGPAPGL
jgi:hypothetical protein